MTTIFPSIITPIPDTDEVIIEVLAKETRQTTTTSARIIYEDHDGNKSSIVNSITVDRIARTHEYYITTVSSGDITYVTWQRLLEINGLEAVKDGKTYSVFAIRPSVTLPDDNLYTNGKVNFLEYTLIGTDGNSDILGYIGAVSNFKEFTSYHLSIEEIFEKLVVYNCQLRGLE